MTTLAFSTTASAVMVAARLAPILTWLPTAPEATKVNTVPLIVRVPFTAGILWKLNDGRCYADWEAAGALSFVAVGE